MRSRRNHSQAFKASGDAIAARKGDVSLAAPGKEFDAHTNQITQWKTQMLENTGGIFGAAAERRSAEPGLEALQAKVGQQALEIDFLSRHARAKRRREHKWTPNKDSCLMRRIDELHLAHPLSGARVMCDFLQPEEVLVGRMHINPLIKKGSSHFTGEGSLDLQKEIG